MFLLLFLLPSFFLHNKYIHKTKIVTSIYYFQYMRVPCECLFPSSKGKERKTSFLLFFLLFLKLERGRARARVLEGEREEKGGF